MNKKNLAVLLAFVCLFQVAFAAMTDDFVITIQSNGDVLRPDTQFEIPVTGFGFNYNVDCNNDGIDEATAQTGTYVCDYTALGGIGLYTIRIKDNTGTGDGFPGLSFPLSGAQRKIISLDQWGTGKWTNMSKSFFFALNTLTLATDTPDFSGATNMSDMFSTAQLANPDTSLWDVSQVTDMSFMFWNANSANPDTSLWDVSKVRNMSWMFGVGSGGTNVLNPDVSNWDTSSVTNMTRMFIGATSANPDMSSWDVSQVTDMSFMFYGVTLPTTNYDATLIGFNAQPLQNGVTFDGGNSIFCSVAAQVARANMIASDNWSITDGGLCLAPEDPIVALDLLLTSDTGISNTDNLTSDATPEFTAVCSGLDNVITIYSDRPVANTAVTTHTCVTVGIETVAVTVLLTEGVHNLAYRDSNGVSESGLSPLLAVTIDTIAPSVPTIEPLANTHLSIEGSAEPSSRIIITGATCTNIPITTSTNGNWSCALTTNLPAGTLISAVAIDAANNESAIAMTTVMAVNVAPSFNVFCDIDATDVTGNSDTAVEISAFIYNITVGPESEATQTYDLSLGIVSGGDPAAIINSMNLNNNGNIALNINIANSGVATLEVTMTDNGGTQFGGVDTTKVSFNIHNYADLNLDPNYVKLETNDILYKNTFDSCRVSN